MVIQKDAKQTNIMSNDIRVENGTATAVEVMTSTSGTMVSSQDNNNQTSINMNNIQYTPELLARYIHYYKTGQDINNPTISSSSTSTNNTAEQQPPKKKKKKKRNKKLKHIPPHQLATRRTIQNCCKTSNLSLAILTFYNALNDLIYIDGSVFYQLLNLCESGSSGGRDDSSGDMRKKVHVGTPKNSKHRDKEKVQGDNSTANGSNSEITETTNNSKSSSIKITLQQRINHATTIHKLLSSLQIPLIEQAYTALIRLSVRNNDYIKAEMYLKEAESTQQCKVKLRLYSTLLRGYCGNLPSDSSSNDPNDDFSSKDEKQKNNRYKQPTKEGLIKALSTWKRLYDNSGGMSSGHPNYAKLHCNNSNNKRASADNGKKSEDTSTNDKNDNREKNQKQQQETIPLFGEGISPKITLSEVEYTSLLKCATHLHDSKVIERVLSNIANEIQVPGRECRDAIINWFKSDTNDKEKAEYDVATESALDEVTLPPSEVDLTTFVCVTNGSGWSVYNNCSIDTTTGQLTLPNTTTNTTSEVCNDEDGSQHTNLMYKLKPVELSTKSWKSMTNMNRTIVLNGSITGNVSKFQGGGKGKKRPRGSTTTNNGMSEVHGTNSNDRKSKSWTVKDNDSTTSTDEKKLNEKEEKKDKPQSNWRINAWNNFEKFIEDHSPYNVVIDGANVG